MAPKGTRQPREDEEQKYIRFVGTRIAQARERLGLTQTELATKFNHHQSWLQRIEAGSNAIGLHDLHRMAQMLKTPVDWFLLPDYKISLGPTPRTEEEWLTAYEEPSLARAHFMVDEVYRAGARRRPALANI